MKSFSSRPRVTNENLRVFRSSKNVLPDSAENRTGISKLRKTIGLDDLINDPDLKHALFDFTDDAIKYRIENHESLNKVFRSSFPYADALDSKVIEAATDSFEHTWKRLKANSSNPERFTKEKHDAALKDLLDMIEIDYVPFSSEGIPQVYINDPSNPEYFVTYPDLSNPEVLENDAQVFGGYNNNDKTVIFANLDNSIPYNEAIAAHEAGHYSRTYDKKANDKIVKKLIGDIKNVFPAFEDVSTGKHVPYFRNSYQMDEMQSFFSEARTTFNRYLDGEIPDELILSVGKSADGDFTFRTVFDTLELLGVSGGYVYNDYKPALEKKILSLKDEPKKLDAFVKDYRKSFKNLLEKLPLIGLGIMGGAAAIGAGGSSSDNGEPAYSKGGSILSNTKLWLI